jgi:spore coat protein H
MHSKKSTLAVLFFSSTIQSVSWAQTAPALSVGPSMYQIDHTNHIILVNQSTQQLNEQSDLQAESILLDKVYSFTEAVDSITTDKKYLVTDKKEVYTLYFTQLPIIHLKTRHQIVDEPRVHATFTMTEKSGKVTTSDIGIEIRGGFSQVYPKKSYRIAFSEDSTGMVGKDVSLLGMRSDDDWNLQALYNEPMRARSKSANELWQEVHQIYYKESEPEATNGIRMEYAELFLNNEYRGLYTVGERMDRKQLKLKKYDGKVKGELYKSSAYTEATSFARALPYNNELEEWDGFEMEYPDEIVEWKNLHDFVNFTATSTDAVFYKEYKSRFHLKNAVDYFIFLNLLRATDNTAKNLYIAKYKSGEPYYFVPWDLDGVLGTNWLGAQDTVTNDILSNHFYDRLLRDYSEDGFRATLKSRWNELRESIITKEHILEKVQTNQNYLADNAVYDREQMIWLTFDANPAQNDYMAGWLTNRLKFLDGYFNQPYAVLASTPRAKTTLGFSVYPNPAENQVNLAFERPITGGAVSVQTLSGKVVLQQSVSGQQTEVMVNTLPAGLYLLTVRSDQFSGTQKLIIR